MIPYNKEFIIDKIKEYEDKIDSGAIGGFEILKRDSLNGKVEGYLYTKYDNITGPIPELIGENKRVWMRLSPKEIEGSYEFIKFATGKVGIVGLGLGYVAQELAKKQDVEKVVVYEISEDVVELYKRNFGENEKIPKCLIPLVVVTTWLTHLFGGSAGREGVAVQLGATVGHSLGRRLRIPNNSRV